MPVRADPCGSPPASIGRFQHDRFPGPGLAGRGHRNAMHQEVSVALLFQSFGPRRPVGKELEAEHAPEVPAGHSTPRRHPGGIGRHRKREGRLLGPDEHLSVRRQKRRVTTGSSRPRRSLDLAAASPGRVRPGARPRSSEELSSSRPHHCPPVSRSVRAASAIIMSGIQERISFQDNAKIFLLTHPGPGDKYFKSKLSVSRHESGFLVILDQRQLRSDAP